jgi:AraC family transcriptional regulator
MTNRDRIILSVDQIESRLRENITVSELARSAGYSLFHFIRLFSGIVGFTPKEYIMRRRLSETAKILCETDTKVIDIAFAYDFQSHEAFSRAFRRQFGQNPSEFRKRTEPPITFERYTPKPVKIKAVKLFRDPDIVDMDRIMLVGKIISVKNSTAEISAIWNRFSRSVHIIPSRAVPERFVQFSFWEEDASQGEFFCMAAAAVTDLSSIPTTMCGKTISDGKYLRFIHRGRACEIGSTYALIYNDYLPGTDFILNKPFNFELYGERCLGPDNPESETEIYIPIG